MIRTVPDAVSAVAAGDVLGGLAGLRRSHEGQARFARLLNWMLFRGIHPEERWRILRTFYQHPEPTIARFYALRLTSADRARMLAIRPPAGMAWGKLARWVWSGAASREAEQR